MYLLTTLPRGNCVHANEVLSGVSIAYGEAFPPPMHPPMNGEVFALSTSRFISFQM